jgi:hypothetical protein
VRRLRHLNIVAASAQLSHVSGGDCPCFCRCFDQHNSTGSCEFVGATDPLGDPIDEYGCWLDDSWAWLVSSTPAVGEATRPEAVCATARVPTGALFTVVLEADPPPPLLSLPPPSPPLSPPPVIAAPYAVPTTAPPPTPLPPPLLLPPSASESLGLTSLTVGLMVAGAVSVALVAVGIGVWQWRRYKRKHAAISPQDDDVETSEPLNK